MSSLAIVSQLLAVVLAAPPAAEQPSSIELSPSSGLVTTLEPNTGVGRDETLAAAHSFAPGAGLQAMGGLARFGALAPRVDGAPVFLDGAPLTTGLAALDELGLLIRDPSAAIEIHRSHTPSRYGSAPAGALVDLVGRPATTRSRAWAEGGFGSYRTRGLGAGVIASPRPGLTLVARTGYAGSRGDFWHFDTVGTPYLFGDDDWRRRASNDYDEGFVHLRLGLHRGALDLSSQLLGHVRSQGVPGPAGGRSSEARALRVSLRSVSSIRRTLAKPGAYLEWVASLAIEGRQFSDPIASLGLARDEERALSLDLWLSPRIRLPLWYRGALTLSAELRGEHVDIRDPYSPPATAGRPRLSSGLAIELEQILYEGRWTLVPPLHFDAALSGFAGPGSSAYFSRTLAFSPRLATRFELIEGLSLRGSVARYMRLPTLVELFGDRGYLVGSPRLQAQSGTRVDGSLWWSPALLGGRALALDAHVLGFVDWGRERIQWVRVGPSGQAINVPRARMRGLELGSRLVAWKGAASLALAYLLLDSQNSSEGYTSRDLPLPGVPRHNLRVHAAGGHRFDGPGLRGIPLALRPFYELEWRSASTLDVDASSILPARVLHALGLSLRIDDRVELRVEGRNLGGAKVAQVGLDSNWPGPYPAALGDLLGFPLPGRSVWLQLRFEQGWTARRAKRSRDPAQRVGHNEF